MLVKHTIDKNVRVSYNSYKRGMFMVNNKIKATRKAAKMTQGELALKLGINRATISKYESGEISLSLEMLRKIAAVLGVEWTELVPKEEQLPLIMDAVVQNTEEIAEKCGMRKSSEPKTRDTAIPQAKPQAKPEEERIRTFYNSLNTDGMLMAGECFLSHLNPEDMKEVADYVEGLAATPQYQRPQDK